MPPIDGLDEVGAWNNREATTAKQVPESMIVLGGGPVGASSPGLGERSARRSPWSRATTRLLSREEPFAGEEVAEALREHFGVDVRTGAKVERVERRRRPESSPQLERGETVEAAEILVAVGRMPHTAELGLDSVGVETDEHGFLDTDDRLRVGGRDWLYAIGDVNGRALFTHMGKYQAWVAAENLLGRDGRGGRRGHRLAAGHLHRPAGRRGRQDARRRREKPGIDARAVDVPTDGTAGASFQGKGTGGTTRLVVDEPRERSSAPPSAASRRPISSTRRRSRSSARCR